jgi:hypothetical protein
VLVLVVYWCHARWRGRARDGRRAALRAAATAPSQPPAGVAVADACAPAPYAAPLTHGIFVVHGADLGATAGAVDDVHGRPRRAVADAAGAAENGKGMVEQLEQGPDASFALVLLGPTTPPRCAAAPPTRPRRAQRRRVPARLLRRPTRLKRVCVLYPGAESFVTDHGIQFLPLDPGTGWHLPLARALKRAGIEIDLNKLA